MGANQSSQEQASQGNQSHGFTIVNPHPKRPTLEETITLPTKVPPLLSVEGHVIDPARHKAEVQINSQPVIEFMSTIDRFSNSRAEFVATRQSQLLEKIIQVDNNVQRFTDSYINDKHKALARMKDDCRKVEEINRTLEKCIIQGQLCVDMLNKLNFLLPNEYKLEDLKV